MVLTVELIIGILGAAGALITLGAKAFDAASNAEHTVSFRCRYRKVSP